MKSTTAAIIWFDDVRGFGFAITPDGKKVFVHRNNFAAGRREEAIRSLVQGSKIECEIQEASDDFTEALNSGSFRDVSMNHRRPKASKLRSARYPRALGIKVVESCGN